MSSRGTRHNRTALHKYCVCVLVDESQLPAIGAKGNFLVRTLRLFPFSDLADALLFIPKLYVQACVKLSECKKIWTSAYTLLIDSAGGTKF